MDDPGLLPAHGRGHDPPVVARAAPADRAGPHRGLHGRDHLVRRRLRPRHRVRLHGRRGPDLHGPHDPAQALRAVRPRVGVRLLAHRAGDAVRHHRGAAREHRRGGWFGTAGTPAYGSLALVVTVATAVIVLACLLVGRGIVKRGAIFWGIVAGSVVALAVGAWTPPDVTSAPLVGAPHLLPWGFGVEGSVVVLMLVAFLQAGTESMGMYTMVASWGGERIDTQRVNRGLFSEFGGTVVGALFGGIGTTSYPENAGIVRVSGIGSRFVTLTAGGIAVALAFLPPVSLFLAGISGPVLAAASTILFGIIAISGIQMLARVTWDDLNLAIGATAFIVALGTQFVPADVAATLPPSIASIVTSPMMTGMFLLLGLHGLVNHGLRPALARREARREDAASAARSDVRPADAQAIRHGHVGTDAPDPAPTPSTTTDRSAA
ncbi:hypothetical protein GW572_00710 [Clavibacter capsici]|nr:hypothetical protein GW572_00710 [Clavibacter capsici]